MGATISNALGIQMVHSLRINPDCSISKLLTVLWKIFLDSFVPKRVKLELNAFIFIIIFIIIMRCCTQPWWLGGRAYNQIQVGCHSCLGGFESRLGMLYRSSSSRKVMLQIPNCKTPGPLRRLSNRLSLPNKTIPLNWLNESLCAYKVKCKKLMLL